MTQKSKRMEDDQEFAFFGSAFIVIGGASISTITIAIRASDLTDGIVALLVGVVLYIGILICGFITFGLGCWIGEKFRRLRLYRGVVLVILILVIGLLGYFAFRNEIPTPHITINSSSSSNASDLPQPPITTVLINKTVRFSGVDITIVNAQQSKAFLDDTNAGTVGVVRVNLKEINASTSNAKYNYFDEARLILPDKTSVAPVYAQSSSGPDAGVSRINWLDFQVPESVQINQLTLQLGRDTKTQDIIPLKGKKV